ncbi:hypothetical protein LOTGIDRAFT_231067 [Lottia gigantea]|uniref:Uncharacterized protein n=1 Tax=Lottia gigantea TaxID=225164 RepID=V4AWM3_LOTGI|nr:hypothetical protein LOTGIDRAFT_231067 [Lottia gigantea]ESO99405.1 hypothetical protein LOTGIDRAFT_231067 [Lottia gigantea]
MQLLFLICLLPTVIGHGDRRGGHDDMDTGKTGHLRVRGKIMMVKGGEWSGHGMDSHEDGSRWGEWSKRHDDNRRKMSGPMHGKKWWENYNSESGDRGMRKRHGQKPWSKMDRDDVDTMDKEWSMEDGDDEERGKWRKDGYRHGRGDRDEDDQERGKWRKDGYRHGKGDQDEDDEERGEWRKDGFRHGKGDRDEDDEGTDKWEMDGFRHGKDQRRQEYNHGNMHGYRMHPKWTTGGNSKEDEVRRAYFRFFGRFNMMKGGREMMDRDQRHGSGKSRGHGDDNDGDANDHDGEMMKGDKNKYSAMMMEDKLKKGMKMLYKQDPHVLGKLITLSFLKMCECEGDSASKLLKKFVAKAEHSDDMEEDTKRPKLPEIPDFGSDTTAKLAFLKNLTEEQRKMLFGYDLVRNMCEAAKTYMVKSKEFYDQYFTDSMMSTTVSTP